eukprot:4830721-Amphidinium_carterae.1
MATELRQHWRIHGDQNEIQTDETTTNRRQGGLKDKTLPRLQHYSNGVRLQRRLCSTYDQTLLQRRCTKQTRCTTTLQTTIHQLYDQQTLRDVHYRRSRKRTTAIMMDHQDNNNNNNDNDNNNNNNNNNNDDQLDQ